MADATNPTRTALCVAHDDLERAILDSECRQISSCLADIVAAERDINFARSRLVVLDQIEAVSQ